MHAILEAREKRSLMQDELLNHGGVLISFTLNIPGSVKQSRLYRLALEEGSDRIDAALKREGISAQASVFDSAAGCCCFWQIETAGKSEEEITALAKTVKKAMTEIEETGELGRILDIDVLFRAGDMNEPVKVSRTELGLERRSCIVCRQPVLSCMRSMRHQVPEVLMKVVDKILADPMIRKRIFQTEAAECEKQTDGCGSRDKNDKQDLIDIDSKEPAAEKNTGDQKQEGIKINLQQAAEDIAVKALKALLYEVIITPKPGLVDTENSGAHRDMDISLFFDSALAITPYLARLFLLGVENTKFTPEQLLPLLRPDGIRAEQAMYRVTGNINTHKGAIFNLGLMTAACGMLYQNHAENREYGEEIRWNVKDILKLAGRIASSMENGSAGLRKEAMNAYPTLREALGFISPYSEGAARNAAGIRVLLSSMSKLEDENIKRRAGLEKLGEVMAQSAEILKTAADDAELLQMAKELDRKMIRWNVSPGGSADLLAAALFLSELGSKKS